MFLLITMVYKLKCETCGKKIEAPTKVQVNWNMYVHKQINDSQKGSLAKTKKAKGKKEVK